MLRSEEGPLAPASTSPLACYQQAQPPKDHHLPHHRRRRHQQQQGAVGGGGGGGTASHYPFQSSGFYPSAPAPAPAAPAPGGGEGGGLSLPMAARSPSPQTSQHQRGHTPTGGSSSSSSSSSSSPFLELFSDHHHHHHQAASLLHPSIGSSSSSSSSTTTTKAAVPIWFLGGRSPLPAPSSTSSISTTVGRGEGEGSGGNAGFLHQLLSSGMPTPEELDHFATRGGGPPFSPSVTAPPRLTPFRPDHTQRQHSSPATSSSLVHALASSCQQLLRQSAPAGPPSAVPLPASNEELPSIFDEIDLFHQNPSHLLSAPSSSSSSSSSSASSSSASSASASSPSSSFGHELELSRSLSLSTCPPPLHLSIADDCAQIRMNSGGGGRRKAEELYTQEDDCHMTENRLTSADRTAKRLRRSHSPPPSLPAPSPSSDQSAIKGKALASARTDINVGVRDQVVYWGNSKNKYDVTVCVSAPARFTSLLKGAIVSYQVSFPTAQELTKTKTRPKVKSRSKMERSEKKATLQLTRNESESGMAELECFLKNCLPSEKLSNLTLLELHLKITLKSNPLGTKGNLQTIASSMESSSGHKLSISCEDRDESEEDPNENDDEYRPTAPGWRGKGLSRGGRTHPVGSYHQQRHLGEEHREVDGVRNQDNPLSSEEDLTSIMRTLPVVTYTHSKAITRALCRLIWYPMNEESMMPTDSLLEKLGTYFRSQLQLPISIYDKRNLAALLNPFTDGISYVDFYVLLGEWFVLAIKMAKKKMASLWHQSRETFVPLLFDPYRRIRASTSEASRNANTTNISFSSSSYRTGGGDKDEWTEGSEEWSYRSRGRKRRSHSGSRASLQLSSSTETESEGSQTGPSDVASMVLQEGQDILQNEGDFLITIGPDLKERQGRAEGEEGRGVNYFPSLKYPLQIVYIKEGGQKQCLSVENKLDKLKDFIHAKKCLRDHLVLQVDGVWKRVPKERFAFNHAQQRRLEETFSQTSVIPRNGSEIISYAHGCS